MLDSLQFKNNGLTVHHTASLTPAAQMPGSPGSHTANIKKHKLAQTKPDTVHTEQNDRSFRTASWQQKESDVAAYVAHVVVPWAGDLR